MALFVSAFYAEKKISSPSVLPLTLKAQMGQPFRDNAVLQQKMPVPVWGKTLPAAKVRVSFDGQVRESVADAEGHWRVTLDPMNAVKLKSVNDTPQGKVMTISCEKGGESASKKLENIIIGDVWICAGQSNMAGGMRRAVHPKNYPANSIPEANYPGLRHFSLKEDTWKVCSPETAVSISRVGFYFIRRVQRETLIPMGVIVRAVGGSNIESWLNQAPYKKGKNYQRLLEPVVGYGIRGVVWYQGESNESDGRGYQPKLESLITGWRSSWGQGDFPFHYVQLPGLKNSTRDNPSGGDGRAEIRQSYVEALRLKNTGLAVTIDIGTPGEHPPNKYDTGIRLAYSVLQKVYGLAEIKACPLYLGYKIEGQKIRVSFDNAESGLMLAKKASSLPDAFLPPTPVADGQLQWLAIQGEDGTWHWAEGKIEGSELVVWNKKVEKPIAVRYAYTTHPTPPLLYNKEGLPVGPFSTIGYGVAQEIKP